MSPPLKTAGQSAENITTVTFTRSSVAFDAVTEPSWELVFLPSCPLRLSTSSRAGFEGTVGWPLGGSKGCTGVATEHGVFTVFPFICLPLRYMSAVSAFFRGGVG